MNSNNFNLIYEIHVSIGAHFIRKTLNSYHMKIILCLLMLIISGSFALSDAFAEQYIHDSEITGNFDVITGEDIVDIIDNLALKPDVVAVDEAFMIENSSTALVKLFKRGIHIVVSSIDLSASCTPFTEVAAMLPFATNVVKCTAVCTSCGTDAPYTKRKFQNEDDEIVVGGSELYEPSCFEHHIYFQN